MYRASVPTILSAVLIATAAGCASDQRTAEPADATVAEKVRRLASMLDYVAADYPAAVADGRIVSQLEYDEQIVFLDDAGELAGELPPPTSDELREGIASVREQVKAKAGTDEVAAAARSLRNRAMEAYGVVIAPTATPSFEQGRALYRGEGLTGQACSQCHGEDGAADTPLAAELTPPPRSFLDPQVMSGLSPVRAFNALTDGIEDTGMTSYGETTPSARWSMAFYVFALRHDEAAIERGREAYEKTDGAVAATPTRLANLTDADIVAELEAAGLPADEAGDALAYLRGEAAFERSGAPMATSREHLSAAVAAYHAGDTGAARRAAAAAYLDGFEPHEAALQSVDPDLVVELEEQFLALRNTIAEGAPADQVEQRALRIGTMLDSADEILAGESGARVAFLSSMAILLREGLEGALLVLLLLGIARRAGADADADARAVHAGWIGALGLGVVTWFASGTLIEHIGGASRELIEGIVALLASAVLLAVSHFVLARLDAARRVAALKEKLAAAASSPRRKLVLASVGFVAVYREAFETVLFLRAIMLDARASGLAIAAGAAAGCAILVVVVFAMARLGKRLRPGPLLSVLGLLLCVLAVALAGKGVRALQEAGTIAITPTGGPRIDWLGFYPTVQTITAQAVVFGAFIALAAWAFVRGRAAARQARRAGAAA